MSAIDKNKPPLKDRLIPWYFVMAFGVVAAVNGVFAVLAVRNNSGVVTQNPYEKGLDYNRTIAKAKDQEALGWQSTLDYQGDILRFTLSDNQNQAISGAFVTVYISRPIEAGNDFTLPLTEQTDGIYEAQLEFPMPGQWETTVNVEWNNQQYQNTKRLVVR